MNEIAQRLALLASKMKEIIRTNEMLKEENNALHQELLTLQQKLSEASAVKIPPEAETIISSTAKPLYIGDNEEAARKKIDELVREIDFCLTLLDNKE